MGPLFLEPKTRASSQWEAAVSLSLYSRVNAGCLLWPTLVVGRLEHEAVQS